MPKLLRVVLAFVAGVVVGSVVNMAIVTLGAMLVPPPAGVDVGDPASLSRAMPLFEPRHFVMPWLAHALGTLAGALTACLLAGPGWRARLAYAVGVFFLCGGVAAAVMIPAPRTFIAADLLLAYLPMAWLGLRLGLRLADRPARSPGPAA